MHGYIYNHFVIVMFREQGQFLSFLIYSFLLWFSFLNLRQNVKGAFLFVFSLGGLRHLQKLTLFRDKKKNKKRKKKVFPFGAKASRFRFRFFAFGGIGWSGDGGKTERMYAPLFSRKDGYTDQPCHTAKRWRFPIPLSFHGSSRHRNGALPYSTIVSLRGHGASQPCESPIAVSGFFMHGWFSTPKIFSLTIPIKTNFMYEEGKFIG